VDDDGQEPDEDDEQQEGRVGGGVLRPDDDGMNANERLKRDFTTSGLCDKPYFVWLCLYCCPIFKI